MLVQAYGLYANALANRTGLRDRILQVSEAWLERAEFERVRKLKEAREAEAEKMLSDGVMF